MGVHHALRTTGLVLATAVAVTAAPAVARTIVDYARNSGHVDGFAAVRAKTAAADRAGKLVATDGHGVLPDNIIRIAPDARRLGGLPANDYVAACGTGAVAGYAQVPGDVSSSWTSVSGYEYSLTEGGPPPPPGSYGFYRCSEPVPSARQVATGVYQLSFGSGCGSNPSPPTTQPFPAVVTVNSSQELVATYTTICDQFGGGFEQQVQIRSPDGTPTSTDFTVEELNPIVLLAP